MSFDEIRVVAVFALSVLGIFLCLAIGLGIGVVMMNRRK